MTLNTISRISKSLLTDSEWGARLFVEDRSQRDNNITTLQLRTYYIRWRLLQALSSFWYRGSGLNLFAVSDIQQAGILKSPAVSRRAWVGGGAGCRIHWFMYANQPSFPWSRWVGTTADWEGQNIDLLIGRPVLSFSRRNTHSNPLPPPSPRHPVEVEWVAQSTKRLVDAVLYSLRSSSANSPLTKDGTFAYWRR